MGSQLETPGTGHPVHRSLGVPWSGMKTALHCPQDMVNRCSPTKKGIRCCLESQSTKQYLPAGEGASLFGLRMLIKAHGSLNNR